MMLSHPNPNEFVDSCKPHPHSAFFIGLLKNQGAPAGQQFDIHWTVDEFKQETSMYAYWKPGIEIFVSHVRRKQIPAFVFPEGHRRPTRRASSAPKKHVWGLLMSLRLCRNMIAEMVGYGCCWFIGISRRTVFSGCLLFSTSKVNKLCLVWCNEVRIESFSALGNVHCFGIKTPRESSHHFFPMHGRNTYHVKGRIKAYFLWMEFIN